MALKILKPTTPTRRHTILLDRRKDVSTKRSEKRLTVKLNSSGGRNTHGSITVRHRGGGAKRNYRIIDFMRDKYDVPAIVDAIEYDPNRSANIALLKYLDGEKRYILAPDDLHVGDQVMSGEKALIKPGNALPLKKMPAGIFVHNVELKRHQGGIIGRSAGANIQIQGGTKGYVQLKMPSGEIRIVREDNYATIGIVGNIDHKNVKLGKAGRKRRMGIRPTVRGVAMSGGKHPHGDGQGKSGRHGTGGPAKDRWGNRIGKRTRKESNISNKFILKRRPVKNGRKFKKFKPLFS